MNEEPFFTVRGRVSPRQFQILCSIYERGGEDGVWVVECPETLGLLANLGRSEEADFAESAGRAAVGRLVTEEAA